MLALGADAYIATDDDEKWAAKNWRSIDLIISAVSSPNMPLTDYLSLLKVGGSYIQAGYVVSGHSVNAFDDPSC